LTTTNRPQGNRPYNRRQRSKFFVRRRVCQFCVDKVNSIDYKDIPLLQKYMSDASKIDSRRKTGVCAKHQRALATAIKRARQVGMVPLDRSHKFVIKQTYQRGPTPRTNEDNISSVNSETSQKTEKETKKTISAEAAAPVEENKASAEADEPAEAASPVEENKASAEADKSTEDTKQETS